VFIWEKNCLLCSSCAVGLRGSWCNVRMRKEWRTIAGEVEILVIPCISLSAALFIVPNERRIKNLVFPFFIFFPST